MHSYNLNQLFSGLPLDVQKIFPGAPPQFKELFPETPPQLDTIVTGAGTFMLFYGIYSIGSILVTGAVNAGLGSIKGFVISTTSDDSASPKTPIDSCFDAIEHTGVFIVRKSMAVLREGFKGAWSGIAHESKAVIWPWCNFYKSFMPRHDSLVQQEENRPSELIIENTGALATDSRATSTESLDKTDSDGLGLEEVYDRLRNSPSLRPPAF